MRLLQRVINDPDDRFPFSHGSHLICPGPKVLACVWFSGSLEGHADVVARLGLGRQHMIIHQGSTP